MDYHIKVRALVTRGDAVLLVEHRNQVSGATWWSPPGGTLEGTESIFDCATREVREETGLRVAPTTIAYVREYLEATPPRHHLELYVVAPTFSGTLGSGVGEQDDNRITAMRFVTRAEVAPLAVFPTILRDSFWDDLRAGFRTTRYLGLFTRD